jgi:hypothetical protein
MATGIRVPDIQLKRWKLEMISHWDASPKQDRFDPRDGRETMKAVVTAGNGGYEQLRCRIVTLPRLEPGEVLLQVLAAGVNNTEINTRVGWYSSSVTTGTEDAATTEEASASTKADGGWNEATPFPFIQGTDCCGRVVAVAPGEDESAIGARVLVRACMRRSGFGSVDNIWMGSDFDGAFAQFVRVPAGEVFAVDCDDSLRVRNGGEHGAARHSVQGGESSCCGSVRRRRLGRGAAGQATGRHGDSDRGEGETPTGAIRWSGSCHRS